MDREILVYIDRSSTDQSCTGQNGVGRNKINPNNTDTDKEPTLIGRLWARVRNGRESATFEYDHAWLRRPERFALEPSLGLERGPHHTLQGKALFGALGDSAPDRWGRVLMRRAERRRAEAQNESPRTLFEADYLLRVNDVARQGALRFKMVPQESFLAPDDGAGIPPLVDLPRLLSAAERVAGDRGSDDDLHLLLAPGSSLGGARPKAAVRDRDGHLLLAKFPHHNDDVDVVRWEGVALSLAKQSGIDVPKWRMEQVGGKPVNLIRRFDRANGRRIPFLSAMSLLGASDNEEHSYLEIADAIRQYGASVNADLAQLWRRIVFDVLISNVDNHLRNHAFLYESQRGWHLSPAYDLNPVPVDMRPRVLSTWIDADDSTASINLALNTAEYYGLKLSEAQAIAAEVARGVAGWRKVAARLGVATQEVERMASAFEHKDMEQVLRW